MLELRATSDFDTLQRLGVAAGLEPGVAPGVEALAGWVAVEDERIVGGVMLERLDGRMLVGWLWVDAARRLQGIGRSLVETVVDEVRRRGGGTLWAVARLPAVFLRCGFEPVAAGPDHAWLLDSCRGCPQRGSTCHPMAVVRRVR